MHGLIPPEMLETFSALRQLDLAAYWLTTANEAPGIAVLRKEGFLAPSLTCDTREVIQQERETLKTRIDAWAKANLGFSYGDAVTSTAAIKPTRLRVAQISLQYVFEHGPYKGYGTIRLNGSRVLANGTDGKETSLMMPHGNSNESVVRI